MDFETIKKEFSDHGIGLSEKSITMIEMSLANNRYTVDNIKDVLEKNDKALRDVCNYNGLFKKLPETYSIDTVEGLRNYARMLPIEVPQKTLDKMEASVRAGSHSPSALADYLQGRTREYFLQSQSVPHLSSAEHVELKDSLGPKYPSYVKNVETLSSKFGVTDNTINTISKNSFNDIAVGLNEYSKALPKVPSVELDLNADSIVKYSKSVGLAMTYEKANVLVDLNLDKNNVKSLVLQSSVESFSKSPEQFKEVAKGIENTLNKSKENSVSL